MAHRFAALASKNLSTAGLKAYAARVRENFDRDCKLASSNSGSHPQLTIGNFTCNLKSLKERGEKIAFASVAAACSISFVHVALLLCDKSQPQFRKYFIRIVLMVPLYAVDAFYALKRPHLSLIYGLGRAAYEAFVLYSFVMFLLTAVGGPSKLARTLRRQQLEAQREAAATCKDGGDVGRGRGSSARFVRCTLLGTLQYVPAMGFVIFLSFGSNEAGQFKEGSFDVHNVWVWCSLVQGVSQTWALTCLVLFYKAVKTMLVGHRPLLKFVCIKLIVFFTWYQSFVIYLIKSLDSHFLERYHVSVHNVSERVQTSTVKSFCLPFIGCLSHEAVSSTEVVEVDAWKRQSVRTEIGEDLGNFLICVEMLAFALLHCVAFPTGGGAKSGTKVQGQDTEVVQDAAARFGGQPNAGNHA
eukprot:g1482.t1